MDEDLHHRIDELVKEEHQLRARHRDGSGIDHQEQARLTHLDEQLDQAWDLLRQRSARRDADQDPELATERRTDQVENYLN